MLILYVWLGVSQMVSAKVATLLLICRLGNAYWAQRNSIQIKTVRNLIKKNNVPSAQEDSILDSIAYVLKLILFAPLLILLLADAWLATQDIKLTTGVASKMSKWSAISIALNSKNQFAFNVPEGIISTRRKDARPSTLSAITLMSTRRDARNAIQDMSFSTDNASRVRRISFALNGSNPYAYDVWAELISVT